MVFKSGDNTHQNTGEFLTSEVALTVNNRT
ncbi:hypothetical protein SAMN04488691_101252 [Haloferax larsenii]|uniref:Uncharacterized protein n=1 Tax=Haloferax larsenii TaxID=302484 RepID=A0A1H7G9I2_HALLR|nr:hypothetical protein SAMN04488691_101252 [Haloferax larsenii]